MYFAAFSVRIMIGYITTLAPNLLEKAEERYENGSSPHST
jgi:hypothetical protein